MRLPCVMSRNVCVASARERRELSRPGVMPSTASTSVGRVSPGSIAIVIDGGAAAALGVAVRPTRITTIAAMPDRTFVKFTFLKLDPAWRRRETEERARDKREFLAACEDFGLDR